MIEVNNSELEQSIAPKDLIGCSQIKSWDGFPSAKMLELNDLEDLLLMTVSPDNSDPHLYHYERNGEHLYLVWIVIHDYFNLNGLPIVIFVRSDQIPHRFIKYKPNSGNFHFVDKVQEPSAAYIKIIKIKQLPDCLELDF